MTEFPLMVLIQSELRIAACCTCSQFQSHESLEWFSACVLEQLNLRIRCSFSSPLLSSLFLLFFFPTCLVRENSESCKQQGNTVLEIYLFSSKYRFASLFCVLEIIFCQCDPVKIREKLLWVRCFLPLCQFQDQSMLFRLDTGIKHFFLLNYWFLNVKFLRGQTLET